MVLGDGKTYNRPYRCLPLWSKESGEFSPHHKVSQFSPSPCATPAVGLECICERMSLCVAPLRPIAPRSPTALCLSETQSLLHCFPAWTPRVGEPIVGLWLLIPGGGAATVKMSLPILTCHTGYGTGLFCISSPPPNLTCLYIFSYRNSVHLASRWFSVKAVL